MKRFLVMGLALVVIGCGGTEDFSGPPEQVTFDPGLNVDLSQMQQTPGGTYWRDFVVGDGDEVVTGDLVALHYTGWLPNGRQFDSSRSGGALFFFEIGDPGIIEGWNDGIPGMKVGGVRQLVIPPARAYGDVGAPPTIPGNTTLVFEIELFNKVVAQ